MTLQKYTDKYFSKDVYIATIKETCIHCIQQHIGILLTKEDVSVDGEKVTIISNSIYRFEILLHKKELQKILQKHNIFIQ